MSSGMMPTQSDNLLNQSNDNNNTQLNVDIIDNDDVSPSKKLGIITTKPKAVEYAFLETRKVSFSEWPPIHHLKPTELAEAGFYYAGYGDCVRCFYCYGGLKNWKPEENVWVEHALWFPKCGYLQQEIESNFINAVQTLKEEQLKDEIPREKIAITLDEVYQRMRDTNTFTSTSLKAKDRSIERDAAVLTVVDYGYERDEICKLALEKRDNGEILSSDSLWEAAKERNLPHKSSTKNHKENSLPEHAQTEVEKNCAEKKKLLLEENVKLRQQMKCKVCWNSDADVVTLPCGHFVACRWCALALKTCPVCRKEIRGIVLAYMG